MAVSSPLSDTGCAPTGAEINSSSKIARFIMRALTTFANHLLTKMLTLAGTGGYRAEYGRQATPTKQAYRALNGLGQDTAGWPMPNSKSSGGDTVGDHGWDGGSAYGDDDADFASGVAGEFKAGE